MKIRICILSLSLFLGLTGCKKEVDNKEVQTVKDVVKTDTIAAKPKEVIKLTEMTFKESEFDFGTIFQTEKVEHVFEFKNTGENDLIISKAYGSCGCTIAEYPKEPIKPGESSKIIVIFDSSGKNNKQNNTINILANIEEKIKQLKITAEIKRKDNQKVENKFKKEN